MMTFVDFVTEYFGHPVDIDSLDDYEIYMLCNMYNAKIKGGMA